MAGPVNYPLKASGGGKDTTPVSTASVKLGTDYATDGEIRLPNGFKIESRNADNDANRIIIKGTGLSDDITFGQNTSGVQIILDMPNQKLRINNQTSGAAAETGTLTNAPSAGNPSFWLPINIAGSVKYIPCWT
jgi:hypothetical protein